MATGGSKKPRQHSAHQGKYKKQFTRTFKNKERAWSKHLRLHPNDKMAKSVIPKARETITKFA